MIADPSGVIVKYNPCTRYARASPCPYFHTSKKCDKPSLTCEMPEYDKWYKDVLNGKRKCFYPNRIRLLENFGVPMFLFHVHHHAIMGEVRIVRSTVEDGKHFYWFDEFLSYPHPVELELLETDPRLPRKARRGRWLCLYIFLKTVEEIRHLARLSKEMRKELGKDIESIMEQLRKRPTKVPSWEYYMEKESKKLKKDYELSELVLAETQKYFAKAIQKKLSVGHSFDRIFYASLYAAFRMLKIPKPPSDIASISGVSPTKLQKLYHLLVWKLQLTVPLLDPKQLIKSRSDKLNVSKKAIERAVSLVEEAQKSEIARGKSASSIAAAALFVACRKENEKIKQMQIAELFNVCTVTIRKYCKKLEELQT